MSDENDDPSSRPAKRVRLDNDNDNGPALTSSSTFDGAAAGTAAPTAAIDEDILRETRAGITEYVCPDNLGFKGVLKQRYTDFLVNEIGLDGKVVRLRCVGVGKLGKENEKEKVKNGESRVENGDKEKVGSGEKTKNGEKVAVEEIKEAHEQNGKVEDVSVQVSSASEETKAEQEVVTEEPEVEVCLVRTNLHVKVTNGSSSPKMTAAR